MKFFSIVALIILVLTMGCGFAIHFGGKEFQNAIKGHMILGILSLIALLALIINVFAKGK